MGARKHSESARGRTPEYRSWSTTRTRCNNPASDDYSNYGGRGISVCERWDCYENFLADMGRRPSAAHSLDRIDRDGDYAPDNCRWSDKREQRLNSRNIRWVQLGDDVVCVKDAAKRLGIGVATAHDWLKRGKLHTVIAPNHGEPVRERPPNARVRDMRRGSSDSTSGEAAGARRRCGALEGRRTCARLASQG